MTLSPTWILLGASVLAVIYLTVRPRKKDPLATQPFRSSVAQQKALERDMQNVVVELSEMARQISAQLDTRAARLEVLLRQADEKLAELRETLAQAPASPAPADVQPPPVPRTPTRLVGDEHSQDRWAEIYRLSDSGLNLQQIAQKLARPSGEIELILALRPKPRPDRALIDVPAPPAVASGQ